MITKFLKRYWQIILCLIYLFALERLLAFSNQEVIADVASEHIDYRR